MGLRQCRSRATRPSSCGRTDSTIPSVFSSSPYRGDVRFALLSAVWRRRTQLARQRAGQPLWPVHVRGVRPSAFSEVRDQSLERLGLEGLHQVIVEASR